MKWLLQLSVWVCGFSVLAESLPRELNKCRPQVSKEQTEEAFAREAAEAANIGDHEAVSRLILTEAAAAGFFSKRCGGINFKPLMEAMAWVVINRVDKISPDKEDPKPDAYFDVIFAAGQFRSAFSASSKNPYAKIFLCPMEIKSYLDSAGAGLEVPLATFKQAKAVAAKVIETYQKSGIPAEYVGVRNYFLPMFDGQNAERPSWAKDPEPKKNKGYVELFKGVTGPCAEFYRLK